VIKFISYPKSGRTWIKHILARYSSEATGTKIDGKYVATIDKKYNLAFTHYDFAVEGFSKFIYLYRHPLDVVVSFYYHLKYRENEDCDINRCYDTKLPECLENYKKYGEIKGKKLSIRYDKIDAPTIVALFRFLDVKIDEQYAGNLLKNTDIEITRNMERAGAFDNAKAMRPADKFEEKSYKARRGKTGTYIDMLSYDQIINGYKMMKEYGWE
jgi:hypothetical protein